MLKLLFSDDGKALRGTVKDYFEAKDWLEEQPPRDQFDF